MSSPAESLPSVPSTVEIDRRKLAVLEGQRAELYATRRVLSVVAERLCKLTGADTLVVDNEAFENAPDIRAERQGGEVVIVVSR